MMIKRLTADEGRKHISALAAVLVDCVRNGASVSFLEPFTKQMAEDFFEDVMVRVEREERILLAAFKEEALLGTVQVVTATPPNQPHRAEVAKLLVRTEARGKGVGRALMEGVEEVCRQSGRTLLTLDTVPDQPGERLYLRMGWTKVGVIPNYAMFPDGRWCDTTIFFKELAQDGRGVKRATQRDSEFLS